MVAQAARLRQYAARTGSPSLLIEASESDLALNAKHEVEVVDAAVAMADEVDVLVVQRVDLVGAGGDELVAVLVIDTGIRERNRVVCLPDEVADNRKTYVWANLRANREPRRELEVVLDVRDARVTECLDIRPRRIGIEDERARSAAVAGHREHFPHLGVLPALEVGDRARADVEADPRLVGAVVERVELEAE